MVIDSKKRQLIQMAALFSVIPTSILGCSSAPLNSRHSKTDNVVIGCIKQGSGYGVLAVNGIGEELYRFDLSARGHGFAISDSKNEHAAVFLRRPGKEAVIFHALTGEVIRSIQTIQNHHFYGHGVYSANGQHLYTTQGNSATSEGMVVVYDSLDSYKVVAKWGGVGTGPHEIHRLESGNLVIAVGGIHTHNRKKLNIDTMQPKLVYMSQKGEILQVVELSEHQASIRHISITSDDSVVFAQQLNGEADDATPLIQVHQFNGPQPSLLQAEEFEWLRFEQYIGSVAASESAIVATSPRGNCVGIWYSDSLQLKRLLHFPDASGVSYQNGYFFITSGSGKVMIFDSFGEKMDTFQTSESENRSAPIAWDNHCIVV